VTEECRTVSQVGDLDGNFSSNRLFNMETLGESGTISMLLEAREGTPGSGESS
jgi:hypothetical protein